MTGIYVRVSTEEQSLNGFSIRAQIEKLKMYCVVREWEIYDVYEDNGISGKSVKERVNLLRLIEDIKNGLIDNVLVYKIDRLTRSTRDLIDLIDLFNAYNCSFNSLTENIDTKSSTGRMFIKIIGIFAEFERESIVERVKLGLERKVKEGYTIGSKNISYGYVKRRGEKIQIINSFESYIVRKIFNMFIDGYSLTDISNYLNHYNIRTKNNKKWNSKNIKLILTNTNYIGKVRYGINKTNYFEIEGRHNSIIDKDLFNKVKNMLNKEDKKSNIFVCSCGNYFKYRNNKYVSLKKRRMVKYFKLYCSFCNRFISINKIDKLMGYKVTNWNGLNYVKKRKILDKIDKIIVKDNVDIVYRLQ